MLSLSDVSPCCAAPGERRWKTAPNCVKTRSVNDVESLAREIDDRKLQRARVASIEEKLLDGPRLFRLSVNLIVLQD